VLANLERKDILSVVEDALHKKYVCIRDVEVVQLFEEYCKLKSQKKGFRELTIPDEAVALLSNIVYVAQKAGVETKEGTTLLKSLLVKDLDGKSSDHLEKGLLDLKRRNLINIVPAENNDAMLIFAKEVLNRIKKIKEWVPRFDRGPI
jgi:hypothetical protein